jgi:hypothetical protein
MSDSEPRPGVTTAQGLLGLQPPPARVDTELTAGETTAVVPGVPLAAAQAAPATKQAPKANRQIADLTIFLPAEQLLGI